jgi:hypothetical protein
MPASYDFPYQRPQKSYVSYSDKQAMNLKFGEQDKKEYNLNSRGSSTSYGNNSKNSGSNYDSYSGGYKK